MEKSYYDLALENAEHAADAAARKRKYVVMADKLIELLSLA